MQVVGSSRGRESQPGCKGSPSYFSQRPMAPDYPYSLVSRELRGIIRGLLTKAAGSLELFFDHCLFTMLQELDKTPGRNVP